MENGLSGYEGFAEAADWLMARATDDRAVAARIRRLVGEALKEAREATSRGARGAMGADPRGAADAVKRTVWRKVFGGSVSVLNRRHGQASGGGAAAWTVTERARRTGRGGNRMRRSARTEQVDGYMGADRAFILRFVNSGTRVRTSACGNRGSIAARNFMGTAGAAAMERAAERLARLIDEEFDRQR